MSATRRDSLRMTPQLDGLESRLNLSTVQPFAGMVHAAIVHHVHHAPAHVHHLRAHPTFFFAPVTPVSSSPMLNAPVASVTPNAAMPAPVAIAPASVATPTTTANPTATGPNLVGNNTGHSNVNVVTNATTGTVDLTRAGQDLTTIYNEFESSGESTTTDISQGNCTVSVSRSRTSSISDPSL